MGQVPSPTAVWYAVAVKDVDRWTLRVSATVDADGGARQISHPPGIDDACDLLRLWYEVVAGYQP